MHAFSRFQNDKNKTKKRIIFLQITFVVKHSLLKWDVFSASQLLKGNEDVALNA